ncbi:MAG TPA: acyltransferase [Caulobacteraceae bacterium]|jgi:peptidoglycan/LPS O-acetylase OafA/YrhL
MAQTHDARLPGIEALRAYAATAIVIFHLIWVGGVAAPPGFQVVPNFFGQGVPLFFAVSAFSLAYGYSARLSTWRDVRRFYVRRFFRIAPLFYAMLLFGLASDHMLLWWALHGVRLPLNLLFLFNLSPIDVDGLVLASWTIGVEMLFYALLPALLPLVRHVWSAAAFVLGSILVAVSYAALLGHAAPPSFIDHGLLFNLPFFAFGLLFARLYDRAPAWMGAPATIAALAGLVALWWIAGARPAWIATGTPGHTVYEALWGLPFGALCLGVALKPTGLISNPVTLTLGRISFSLYLAHPHIVSALKHAGFYSMVQASAGGPWLHFAEAFAGTYAIVVVVALALYRFIESPGIALGGRVLRRMGATPAPALAPAE